MTFYIILDHTQVVCIKLNHERLKVVMLILRSIVQMFKVATNETRY